MSPFQGLELSFRVAIQGLTALAKLLGSFGAKEHNFLDCLKFNLCLSVFISGLYH